MQPHSTCALALANYIYNHNHQPHRAKGLIRITFQNRFGEYKNLIYTFEDLRSKGKEYKKGFSVYVKKSGDPLSCILTVNTPEGEYYEGRHYYITHGTQHVAGLEEHFDLYRNSIKNGKHRNSQKYDEYSAEFYQDNQISVHTALRKTKKHERAELTLNVKIESMNMQFLPEETKSQKTPQHRGEEELDDSSSSETDKNDKRYDGQNEANDSSSILSWKDLLLFGTLGILIVTGIMVSILWQLFTTFVR